LSARRAVAVTAWVVAGAMAVVLVLRAVASKGYYWADDYGHLEISRSAWSHPTWLLDVWGRPLMTLVYMPGAPLGDAAVRATSLVVFALTAVLCVAVARRRNVPFPVIAACLLVAQPLAARVAFSALPYTVFSLVVAGALWLRTTGRHRAAALTVSVLPLARLEGLVVVAVWAVVVVRERRWRDLPLLATGMAAWAAAGALVHGDLLWLLHANPYGITVSRYGPAGWDYFLRAFPIAVGPIMAGLLIAAVACRRATDVMIDAIAVALVAFYTAAWGLGWFQTDSVPVYLATASVPFALIGHQVVAGLLDGGLRVRPAGAVIAAVVVVAAIFAEGRPADLAVACVAGGLIVAAWWARGSAQLRSFLACGTVVLVALAAVVLVDPLPLGGGALASRRLVASLGPRADEVLLWTHPAFGWYADRVRDDRRRGFGDVPDGGLVVYDSEYGPAFVRPRRLARLGYRKVQQATIGGETVALWRRR
jgi:hypothetical protein